MIYTRREFGKLALGVLPMTHAAGLFAPLNTINGVKVGAISYSFRPINQLDAVIKSYVDSGINVVELMSATAELAAGADPTLLQPRADGSDQLRKWRLSVSIDEYKKVRKKFDAASLELALLCFNMSESITNEEIDYAFQMATALGVRGITSTTQLTVAKRIAPYAEKHKMVVGFHNHSNRVPNEFCTPDDFAQSMSFGKYNKIELDIGHFTAANFDAVRFIREQHSNIVSLHLKDRMRDNGPNQPWGKGQTPVRDVLRLLRDEKYPILADIELEYPVPEGSNSVAEVKKCLQYCKDALA